jgi:hypothetical protein
MKVIATSLFPTCVFVGSNPEMADIANPDGAIYEERLSVEAITDGGRRWIHPHMFTYDEIERAENFADRVMIRGSINIDLWVETYEVYGSPAWEAADRLREIEWQSNPNTAGFIRDF